MSAKRFSKDQVRKNVLIVDDHPITRAGLIQLINQQRDLRICGEAQNADEAIQLSHSTKPDLAIVDLTLQGKGGLELVKDFQLLHPHLAILVLSMHDESLYAERVLRAGARGYITKREGGAQLIQAVRQVLMGHVYVSEKMSGKIMQSLTLPRRRSQARSLHNLTDRELEVLTQIGEGLSRRKIAEQLQVSVRTVEAHRAHIRTKLGLPDAAALVHYATRWVANQSNP